MELQRDTTGHFLREPIQIGAELPTEWSAAMASLRRARLVGRVGCVGFHMQQLFEGLDFIGKRVLDIGGGFGMASLFAAAMGAERVICLEPGSAGSSTNDLWGVKRGDLGGLGKRIEFIDATLQDYLSAARDAFEVVISNNSINHLDEPACMRLDAPEGREVYRAICNSIRSIMSPGGHFVVSDCSRTNALEMFGLRHPLRLSIEPLKHWNPTHWMEFIEPSGFKVVGLRWLSINSLGRLGTALMNNQTAAFVGSGAFRITFSTV